MQGLIALIVVLIYTVLCASICKALAKLTKALWGRRLIYVLLFPLFLIAPLADEIVGKFQFDALCKQADEVKIYGTISVGEDFYYPDGRWRFSGQLPGEEIIRLNREYDKLVDHIHTSTITISVAIPIRTWEVQIVERKTGRKLASTRWYATDGGLIGRILGHAIFVKEQCRPSGVVELSREILKFKHTETGVKK